MQLSSVKYNVHICFLCGKYLLDILYYVVPLTCVSGQTVWLMGQPGLVGTDLFQPLTIILNT